MSGLDHPRLLAMPQVDRRLRARVERHAAAAPHDALVLDDELAAQLSAATTATSTVVRGIIDEQLHEPTPCAGYDVRGVLNHLMGVLTVAERAGRKAEPTTAAGLYTDRMAGDWRTRFHELAAAAQQAWMPASAWQGNTELLGSTVAAGEAGRKLMGELVVHGWDLACATRQPYQPDQAAMCTVYYYFERTLDNGRSPGAWGPQVSVPPDAPTLPQVLGLSGRDPHWSR